MTRALLFDLDDTLYPERRFLLSGLAAVAAEVQAWTRLDRRLVFRHLLAAVESEGRRHAFQSLCGAFGLDPAIVPRLVRHYRSHQPRLPRSTVRTLQSARRTWRTAVLTNGLPDVQRRKIAALGIADLVDAVLVASEWGSGRGKPEPHGFLAALDRLGVEPAQAVFAGDDPACDVLGARALGLATIRVRTYAHRWSPPEGDADAVVDRLPAVPAVASRLLRGRHVTCA